MATVTKLLFLIAGKDAKRKLDEKNKLLLELQQKLVPLEKETADNLLGAIFLLHLKMLFQVLQFY